MDTSAPEWLETEEALRVLKALLRRDFYSFAQKVFYTTNPDREFVDSWALRSIAHHLQQVAARRIKRLIITLPPRSLKSTMVSVALPSWLLGQDPSLRVICASHSGELSFKFARDTRSVMTSRWYQDLFPQTRIDPRKNSDVELMTTKRGGRLSTSVGGTLTGRGGDILVIDDPIKPSDADSEARRREVIEWFTSTAISRLDDKHDGAMIVVMQRVHVDDLAGYLKEQGGWTVLELPAIAEEEQSIQIGGGHVYRRKVGELLFPEREPRELLDQIRREMGSYAFSAQYQQNPAPREGTLIKRSWFGEFTEWPARPDLTVISWDTASKTEEIHDYSVGTIWYVCRGLYHLVHVNRLKLTFPDLLRFIMQEAKFETNPVILIEESVAAIPLIQSLKERGVNATGIKPEGDKIMRVLGQTPLLESGKVMLPDKAPWKDSFLNEICSFPGGKHDDQVDSMTQALKWMVEKGRPNYRIRNF
jgi:predicted phage terminase large subunit-like protein